MKKNLLWTLCLVGVLVGLDQWSKVAVQEAFVERMTVSGDDGPVERRFAKRPAYEVIPGLFNIAYVENPGITFGMLRGMENTVRRPLLIAVPCLVMLFLLRLIAKTASKEYILLAGFACILGGAIGNVIDRIRLNYVIDFLDFFVGRWHWPAFNIADSAICVGMGLLVIEMIRGKEPFHVGSSKKDH